jgi:hypothetical protein
MKPLRRVKHCLKHSFYSAGWKKFERAWDLVIRIKQLSQMRPILEAVLAPVASAGTKQSLEGVPTKPMELSRGFAHGGPASAGQDLSQG